MLLGSNIFIHQLIWLELGKSIWYSAKSSVEPIILRGSTLKEKTPISSQLLHNVVQTKKPSSFKHQDRYVDVFHIDSSQKLTTINIKLKFRNWSFVIQTYKAFSCSFSHFSCIYLYYVFNKTSNNSASLRFPSFDR